MERISYYETRLPVTAVLGESDAGPEAPPFLAYLGTLSARAGDDVSLHVSTRHSEFSAQLVRILRGGPRPVGEPSAFEYETVGETQLCRGHQYDIRAGSGAVAEVSGSSLSLAPGFTVAAMVWPTLLSASLPQTILSATSVNGAVLSLLVENGRLALTLLTESGTSFSVTLDPPLAERRWYMVGGSIDLESGELRVMQRPLKPYGTEVADPSASLQTPDTEAFDARRFSIGCASESTGGQIVTKSFNGKIARPVVLSGARDADDLASELNSAGSSACVARWDFTDSMGTRSVLDTGPNQLNAITTNSPVRAVTGPSWDGTVMDYRLDRTGYDAIHFHDDDIDDCQWPSTAAVSIPSAAPSGCYAVRIVADADEDFVPLIVTATVGTASNRIAFLASTYTYLAYANFETSGAPVEEMTGSDLRDPIDAWITANPTVGLSLYDTHSDGSGIHHSTALRPLLTTRPHYRWWLTGGAGWSFNGDLYVIDWLAAKGYDYDVISDHELRRSGVDLLSQYDVVLTGMHPEYHSIEMLDAVEQYTQSAGNLMYLGGNGFYWVITVPEDRPDIIELRRSNSGTRTWESGPGEGNHSTTGEPGGLWRNRGRAPQSIVGVGFSAEGGGGSAGYARLPDSFDETAAFIFEGVGPDEIIGEFGIHGGGAAGSEIDRADVPLGTPPDALILATSSLRQNDLYMRTVEEILFTVPDITGSTDPTVRADLVYFTTAGGGRVFTPGSIDWTASLSHKNFDNNVSRITENVLRSFMDR